MCLDLLCCCCDPSACGLCCCSSKMKNSITTRLLYVTFLVFVLVVSAIMLAPTVQQWLASAPILCADFNFQRTFPSGIPIVGGDPILNISRSALISCSQFVGYLAVYRVCIAVASFFFLMILLMLCVFNSKDPRSYIQNGFWCIKWLVVLGLVVAFFFIPDGSNYAFSQGFHTLRFSSIAFRNHVYSPGNADSEHFKRSMASVWVKMATVWLCFVIYLWTLLAPLILGNSRDFEYNSE